ncbi:hypothetical protein DPX16_19361 [Anabarilius grahami]|uniref:Uncharacterized protein n=1 Tax=Anabarilius grahami TaxID=495550 RepID=A0A3N0Z0N8_ANAGA|nr:hypothetical protein DPX16_19361 [Anabarilius grahami]
MYRETDEEEFEIYVERSAKWGTLKDNENMGKVKIDMAELQHTVPSSDLIMHSAQTQITVQILLVGLRFYHMLTTDTL